MMAPTNHDTTRPEDRADQHKTLVCTYCQKRFRRFEHLRRHERIHTKEKPYHCETCDKSFSRSDLLARHKRLVHLKHSRTEPSTDDFQSPTRTDTFSDSTADPYRGVVGHNAEADQAVQSSSELIDHIPNHGVGLALQSDTSGGGPPGFESDFNFFLDGFDTLSYVLPPSLHQDYPAASWLFNSPDRHAAPILHMQHDSPEHHDQSGLSRIGSRLPSLEPVSTAKQSHHPSFVWKVSSPAYREICTKLEAFSHVLPDGFILPSRHALTRFLEGCITGFLEHLPFIHIASFSVMHSTPELLLGMASIGAQYKFEASQGEDIFFAARGIALEQVRRRAELGAEVSLASRLQTLQALLCLMAMATWSSRTFLTEAISLQSTLVVQARNIMASLHSHASFDLGWEAWILHESCKRTYLILYCFYNLHSIAYNISPLMFTAEIQTTLPSSTQIWKANEVEKWVELCQRYESEAFFQHAFSELFGHSKDSPILASASSFGNYVLVSALVQRIFLLRQSGRNDGGSLKGEDIQDLQNALSRWQVNWQKTPESSLEPLSRFGPMAFNSTALLRLAWIRIYWDLGPSRYLESRDPFAMATGYSKSHTVQRDPQLSHAILHAVHALSIPIRMGIHFVSRTQAITWSQQHSLCNLECAVFLSKWLETMARTSVELPLTAREESLIYTIQSMLKETGLLSLSSNQGITPSNIKQIAVAVVRVWATVFKGGHAFKIVGIIAQSLDVYGDMLARSMRALDAEPEMVPQHQFRS